MSGCRIALTCSGLDHVHRGVETWSQQAFLGLKRQGSDVTLFKGSGTNGAADVKILPCIRRDSRLSEWVARVLSRGGWRLGLGSPYQTEQTTFAISLLGSARTRFDILHTKDPQVALLFHLAHKAGLSRPKVILNHGTEEPPEFLGRFDYIQHLAPFHQEEAVRQGVQARRHFAIPNFVDTETFHPGSGAALRSRLGIPQEAFVVLSVAAIKRHHKRMDWLIREAARVASRRGRPVHLLAVGSPTKETDSIIQMGRSLLGSRVTFLTDLAHSEMPEVYRAADLLALCSLKEMLANVYLEAMASGVPCLGSRFPVCQWVISDGGETVDMERPGALAAAIAKYQVPDHRRQTGERARQHAVQHFSRQVVLEQQMKMYREVMADGEGRS